MQCIDIFRLSIVAIYHFLFILKNAMDNIFDGHPKYTIQYKARS